MNLLLDEMLHVTVAQQLRARGHDVVAVTERDDLRGASDDSILRVAQAERRAVVTENVGDFRSRTAALVVTGQPHTGLILSSNRTFPRGEARTIGRLVTSLERLLAQPPPGDSWERWLS